MCAACPRPRAGAGVGVARCGATGCGVGWAVCDPCARAWDFGVVRGSGGGRGEAIEIGSFPSVALARGACERHARALLAERAR